MSQQGVLIVDDDEHCRHELAAALQGLELATDEAEGSEEALEKIESQIFDLVLLDVTLSGMDGRQALRRLRHIHPRLPVVLMTRDPSVEDVVDAMRDGAVDFLEKPFQAPHVREIVRKVLGRRAAADGSSNKYHTIVESAKERLDQGDYDDAVEHLKSAIALAPGRPEAFNLLGAVHEQKGDPSTAVKYYRAACGLDLSYKPADHNLERLTVSPRTGPSEIEFDDGPSS